MKKSNEQGFSLAELLVVAVLGSLVLMSTYQVVLTNQRVYTAQQVQIQGQQSVRAGADVLFGELREISPREGDILAMDDASMTVRVLRTFGHVCAATDISPFRIRVRPVGPSFIVGQTISFFADYDPGTMADDRWHEGVVSSADNSSACSGSETQQRLTVVSLTASLAGGEVQPGAPVRAFEERQYGLVEVGGESYLGSGGSGESLTPLVGPLRSTDGVTFEALDSQGQPVTGPPYTQVAQIRVTLRTSSEVRDSRGDLVRDSLVTTIYTRN